MKIYGIRESCGYEIHELIEFYSYYTEAAERAYELNMTRPAYYGDYKVEEIEVK